MRNVFLILLSISGIIFVSCSSSSNNPINSSETEYDNFSLSELPFTDTEDSSSNSELTGTWRLEFDPEMQSLQITPTRLLAAHWDVSYYLPVPSFEINSFDPFTGILDVDATITNPTIYTAHDLRMIVYTDNYGCRLKNPDDWTGLFDIPAGGGINPFKAYAKSESQRIFADTQHTEKLLLWFPAGWEMLDFALTASWPDNCDEPYSIEGFSHENLSQDTGAQALTYVDVFDWQDDVDSVLLYCPSITSLTLVPFSHFENDTWVMTLTNNNGASAGTYTGAIIATSSNSGSVALYDLIEIEVSEISQSDGGYSWSRTFGGISDDKGTSVAVDSLGNIYLIGNYRDTVDFDTGESVDEHISNGDWDIFMCKFDPAGNFVWAKTWGGFLLDEGSDIAIDSSDNIYVSGLFCFSVDLDPGPGEDMHYTDNSGSMYPHDAFLSKFDVDGNYVWGLNWGGTKNEFTESVGFDIYENIFVTGSFWIDADMDPDPIDQDIHIAIGRNDAFVSAFNPDGDLIVCLTWGGAGEDTCKGMVNDDADNFFLITDFEGTVDFDPSVDEAFLTSNGDSDIGLSKFDFNADIVNAVSWGGIGGEIATGMEIDSSGNIHVTGNFEYTVDFDPGAGTNEKISNGLHDCFVSKLDNNCDFVWVNAFGGMYGDSVFDLTIDTAGKVITTGSYKGSVDFNSAGSGDWHMSNGCDDVFLLKLDDSGNFVSALTWGGGDCDYGYGVAHYDSDIFVTGGFEGLADFNPGNDVDEHVSMGDLDAFLVMFDR